MRRDPVSKVWILNRHLKDPAVGKPASAAIQAKARVSEKAPGARKSPREHELTDEEADLGR